VEGAVTALQTLARFLAEDVQIPAATRAQAVRHLTDMVGAWVAGAGTPEGRRMVACRAALGGGALADDVALACALARLSEIDSIHLESSTTPGGIVVPAALTIAARLQADGDAVLDALVGGIEAMVRLGAAIGGPTVLYRGIWPTYFATPFGVAAVASRLYRLDAAQTAHALALALTVASPGVGHHNAASTSRWFAVAQAARSGLVAAQAARDGFTSDLALLDSNFLSGIYGVTPDLRAFSEGLGRDFALDRCSFKPWCAARQTMAATQGLKEILASGVAPDDVAAVEVRVPPTYHKMVDHGVTLGDRASFLTSLPYHLAIAALDPEAAYDIGQSPARVPEPVAAFMRRVTVTADERLLPHYPRAWPADVTVRTAAGAAHAKLVLHVPGEPDRPLDDAALEQKFRRVVAPRADELLTACRALADDGSPVQLVALIADAVRGLPA
jgi:2-methylcitrate dehydratase PrpD